MNQELLDKIQEIYDLTLNINGDTHEDDVLLGKIQQICDQILTDEKVNQRLEQQLS